MRLAIMRRALGLAAVSILLAGCSVFGVRSGLEMPDYKVVATLGEDLQVRRYGERIAAEATVTAASVDAGRSRAFRLLFDYIKGANRGSQDVAMTAPVETGERGTEIAMTAPVETETAETTTRDDADRDADRDAGRDNGRTTVTMRFLLPSKFNRESAPVPTHEQVRLVTLPAETMAVLRFSGFGGRSTVARRQQELQRRLKDAPWTAAGQPVAMFYDPPWTLPFLRRNEVAVPVSRP
jgi:hypothetical protein